MSRLHEFFEVKGSLSMRNLTVFITIMVASAVVLYLGFRINNAGETRLTSEIFMAYMLAGGGVYGFGKWQDAKTDRAEVIASSDNPHQPSVQNVTINQPEAANVSNPTQ